jgi:hypothetical protein
MVLMDLIVLMVQIQAINHKSEIVSILDFNQFNWVSIIAKDN